MSSVGQQLVLLVYILLTKKSIQVVLAVLAKECLEVIVQSVGVTNL